MRFTSFAAAAAALLLGASNVVAEDLRREVYTIDAFCRVWNDTCIAIGHRAGKAYTECSNGYDGNGTATVNCYVVSGDQVTDYNANITAAIGATYV